MVAWGFVGSGDVTRHPSLHHHHLIIQILLQTRLRLLHATTIPIHLGIRVCRHTILRKHLTLKNIVLSTTTTTHPVLLPCLRTSSSQLLLVAEEAVGVDLGSEARGRGGYVTHLQRPHLSTLYPPLLQRRTPVPPLTTATTTTHPHALTPTTTNNNLATVISHGWSHSEVGVAAAT